MSDERIAALERALAAAPDDTALRRMLAELFAAAGRPEDAVEHWRVLVEAGAVDGPLLVEVGMLAVSVNALDLAGRCLDRARELAVVDGVAKLQGELDAAREARGVRRLVRVLTPESPAAATDGLDVRDGLPRVTFADVGGLDELKKLIHRRVILPLEKPELFERFKRSAGGGVLLYGPPGCGKTLLARATAGECGLPFLIVRIEEVLDPWFGVSERRLHEAFDRARKTSPCVMFLDELDALAFSRRRQRGGGPGRTLVDQLLQELDGIGTEGTRVLVLGATNAPWDLDDAVVRPGRFDRTVFVPPPDAVAREHILRIALAERPAEPIDLRRIAGAATLYSGADLAALVERAVDAAIEDTIASGAESVVTERHVDAALREVRPTTLDWLQQARGFVEFANQTERWADVAAFLKSPEVKRLRL
jgi:ATP-dependent 26S proteasome regulatory subunit